MHTCDSARSAVIKCVFGDGFFGILILDVPGLVAWRSHGSVVKIFRYEIGIAIIYQKNISSLRRCSVPSNCVPDMLKTSYGETGRRRESAAESPSPVWEMPSRCRRLYNYSRLLGSIWPGNEPAIGTMSGEIDALYIYDEHK